MKNLTILFGFLSFLSYVSAVERYRLYPPKNNEQLVTGIYCNDRYYSKDVWKENIMKYREALAKKGTGEMTLFIGRDAPFEISGPYNLFQIAGIKKLSIHDPRFYDFLVFDNKGVMAGAVKIRAFNPSGDHSFTVCTVIVDIPEDWNPFFLTSPLCLQILGHNMAYIENSNAKKLTLLAFKDTT